jgi:hypothetical protein
MMADLRVPADCLESVGDADLAWRVIERAYAAVDLYDGPEVLAADLARLTPGQRALLALHWCVAETSNGGFDQLFTNPSGLLVDEVRSAFERIGAMEAAGVLAEARRLLASRPREPDAADPGCDETEDADRFEAYLARYEPLEERFHALMDHELYPRAAAYVRAHPQEFVEQRTGLPRGADG